MARKRRKKSKNYFTQDTEDAIVKFVNEEDQDLRNKIYREEIHYAFTKLTENIIHTYKYYYTDNQSVEELQHNCIIFLLLLSSCFFVLSMVSMVGIRGYYIVRLDNKFFCKCLRTRVCYFGCCKICLCLEGERRVLFNWYRSW